MNKSIKDAIINLEKKEVKLLFEPKRELAAKKDLYSKIPPRLIEVLETAFRKAFEMVFLHGTSIIEKTFNKEDITLNFDANDYVIEKHNSIRSVNRMDKASQKSNFFNNVITTTSGLGMGLIGMGLPDIPVLVSTILKGIYEIALSYGFSYNSTEDKIYILKLIQLAICDESLKVKYNQQLDDIQYTGIELEDEIEKTTKVLAESLLVEKFIQGIPIIGVVGGFVNHVIYRKITTWGVLKYKKRYLLGKLEGN